MLILDAGGLQIRQSCATEKGTALQMLILDAGGLQIRQSCAEVRKNEIIEV